MRSPDRPVTVTATVRPSRRSARRADGLSASGTATLPPAPIVASARPSSGEESPSLRARRAVTVSVTATRAPAGPVTVAVVPRRASVAGRQGGGRERDAQRGRRGGEPRDLRPRGVEHALERRERAGGIARGRLRGARSRR